MKLQSLLLCALVLASTSLVSCSVANAQPAFSSQSSGVGTAGADFLMTITGIDGESQEVPGAIDVSSFSWGVQLSVNQVGGGAGAGKASFQDFHFTKTVDKSSPVLMKACASGTHIPEVKLTARKAGGKQQEYLIYTLKDVIVTSYQPGGASGGNRPVENLGLNFAQIATEYREQRPDGSFGAPIVSCWDLRANRACQ